MYRKNNLRLIVTDECGDDYCFKAFRIPEAEELTRDEVEAYKAMLFSRVAEDIPTEARGWYWLEDFETREEREAAYDAELAYYTELCNGDEEMAYQTMRDVAYCERMGC